MKPLPAPDSSNSASCSSLGIEELSDDKPARALLMMVAAHFCFSLMLFFIKSAQKLQLSINAQLPPGSIPLATFGTWESVLFRSFPMTLICICIIARRKAAGHMHRRLEKRDLQWLITRGVVGAISMACFFYGTLHIPLALSSLFANSSVFLIGILAHFLLKERLTPERILFALGGLAGVALVLGTGVLPEYFSSSHATSIAANSASNQQHVRTAGQPLDYLISFISGVLSAIAYFSVRKMKSVPSNTIILSLSASGVLLALLAGVFLEPLHIPKDPGVLALLCLSSLPAILAQYLMTWSFQSAEAGFVALGQYSGPVFAALIGTVAFAERLTPLQWLGASLAIVFGVMMPLVDERSAQGRLLARPQRVVQALKERIRSR